MPQYPIPTQNVSVSSRKLNITAATVVKAAPGRVIRVQVLVAGTGTGTLNDCLTTGAAAAANQIATIPEVLGPLEVNAAFQTGIVLVPGTGQTLAIYYN